ncbi:HlyD family efflux transporter periplasmic adaptor subunit [Marinobacterium maritimum]|uniref:HlyD family efflux transporter periplasmic adaptor subunit n=1 Tax=Marinobacterium maritimum TaxID=500162 RepID=A0ABP3TFU0_9GAMM
MNVAWRRRLIWSVLLLLIAAALGYGLRPQPRMVDIATAAYGPMRLSVEEEGKTRVKDRYEVSASVAGTTCRVDLNVGDAVKKGQLLTTIEPLESQALDPRSRAEAEARVAAAQSALHAAEQTAQSAESERILADQELSRLRPLFDKGHIARRQLDQATAAAQSSRAASRSARFSVEVARHELEAARTALSYTGAGRQPYPDANVQVLSPIDGRILAIHQECEGVVSAGQPLLVVGDIRSLEIETDVLSADAVKIKPGMRVEFHRWGGDTPLQGRVRNVEPVGFTKISALGVEEQRVLVISDITSDAAEWQDLGDGYRVEAEIILWESADVLQIPASALFRFDGGWALFVMENGKAVRRLVKVGKRNGLSAQIMEGIAEGENLITHPDNMIDDGVPVRPR